MAESKEELKSLLMRVKEESEKAGLKVSIQKGPNNSNPFIGCMFILFIKIFKNLFYLFLTEG